MMTKYSNNWDSVYKQYLRSIQEDSTGIFSFENNVNTLSILNLCPDIANNVLDLGCGDGRFTHELCNRYKYVTGVDNSKHLLEYAKQSNPNAQFLNFDIERTFPNFNGKFDLITAKLLLMYIQDLDNVATQCYKVLRSGGFLVISVTHPTKWLNEKYENSQMNNYKGYLVESTFESTIAHNDKVLITFVNRSIEKYVNTFTKHGFTLVAMLEPGIPDTFVLKYPQYLKKQYYPFRLNLEFVKT